MDIEQAIVLGLSLIGVVAILIARVRHAKAQAEGSNSTSGDT